MGESERERSMHMLLNRYQVIYVLCCVKVEIVLLSLLGNYDIINNSS